jgi:diguanylate cyclase (GGDEF)-like protein
LADRLWPEKLQELQDALSRSFALPILVVEPSGRPLTACEDLSQYCRRLTRCIPLSRPCLDCGRAEHGDDPPEVVHDPVRGEPAVHHCPLGLADVAAPVYSAGQVIGYLLSPQVVVAPGERGREASSTGQETRSCPTMAASRLAAQGDDCAALVARAAVMPLEELLRIESGLVASSWLLGSLASARCRNLRLSERLREQSRWMRQHVVTDAVTGLANRRRFMEALASEVRRVRRYRRAMALVVLEVDSLREINGEFGHDIGDAVLAAVANCLTSTLRQTDAIGRVSGDGFGILMPETARNQALVAVGRVASAIDDLNASGELPVEVRFAAGIVDGVAEPEEMLCSSQQAAALARSAGVPAVHPL